MATTASFSEAGTYLLKMSATDGDLSATSVVIIIVNTPPCWGDTDNNGFVDGDDLAILAYAWLSTPTSGNWFAPADLTFDGVVNGDDLGIVAYGWLQCRK